MMMNQLYVINPQKTSSSKGKQDIVFKTADKGGGWVMMDKNYYWDKIVKKIYFLKCIKRFLLTVRKVSFQIYK